MTHHGFGFKQKETDPISELVFVRALIPNGLDDAHMWALMVGQMINPPNVTSSVTGPNGVEYRVSHGHAVLERTRGTADFLTRLRAGAIGLERRAATATATATA